MLLTIQNIKKSFAATTILTDISAVLDKQDRVGVIGENGAGKTTLIKLIIGQLAPDSGTITFARGTTLGYLEQNSLLNAQLTVYGEMENAFAPVLAAMDEMKTIEEKLAQTPENASLLEQHAKLTSIVDAADGYHMDTQIKKILNGMAFPAATYDKSVSVLSGGEHTRLCLAKLLLQKPDILILDEPTNHLDFDTMEWLEAYLKMYAGAILVVSHDRYFLDAVCNRIFEIEDCTLKSYKGNYSAYLPQKEMAMTLQQKQHDADVEKAAKLEDYVARNLVRASTTKMAQSRRKQLEKLEITEQPHTEHADLKFRFTFDVTPYNEILTAKNLSVTLGGKCLIDALSLQVKRGERLVIAGPNGAGKSTLLRVLDGKLKPNTGTVRLGVGAKPSIFEQQQLRRGGTVISAIWDKYPKFTELEVRSHLAKLNFRGETVFKSCAALSGGELARLRFSEILLEKPNLLFLDEPTNHLDIFTRESLGAALAAYEGTLILVTHDRYLMNSLACPILYLEDGKATQYASYDAMQHRKDAPQSKTPQPESSAPKAASYGKEQRRRKAELRTKIKELEDEMETLSLRCIDLEAEINDPETLRDHMRLRETCDALDDAKFRQEEAFNEWETLIEEQDALIEDAPAEE
ncbi:MAG: ABC-F family ATP-binding cassette domain-containing protein [Ruthenibacterium sp.]